MFRIKILMPIQSSVPTISILCCFQFKHLMKAIYLDKFCYFSTDHFKIQTQKVTCNWPAFYSFYWRIKNFNCGVCSLSLKLWLMFSTNLVKFNFATFRNSCSNYLLKVLVCWLCFVLPIWTRLKRLLISKATQWVKPWFKTLKAKRHLMRRY